MSRKLYNLNVYRPDILRNPDEGSTRRVAYFPVARDNAQTNFNTKLRVALRAQNDRRIYNAG